MHDACGGDESGRMQGNELLLYFRMLLLFILLSRVTASLCPYFMGGCVLVILLVEFICACVYDAELRSWRCQMIWL